MVRIINKSINKPHFHHHQNRIIISFILKYTYDIDISGVLLSRCRFMLDYTNVWLRDFEATRFVKYTVKIYIDRSNNFVTQQLL